MRKRPKAEIAAKVDELLRIVGLDGYQARYPAQLSGGQRQRMALARALAVEPEVLLLDEPFGALDANVRAELREWLRRLHDEVHVTTVLVTHDQEEAMEVADRIVVLNHGRIEQDGPPRDLYERPANAFVMGFLGPVARLGDTLVRPHDLRMHSPSRATARSRPRSRASCTSASRSASSSSSTAASRCTAQLTRDEAAELELRARRHRVGPPAGRRRDERGDARRLVPQRAQRVTHASGSLASVATCSGQRVRSRCRPASPARRPRAGSPRTAIQTFESGSAGPA